MECIFDAEDLCVNTSTMQMQTEAFTLSALFILTQYLKQMMKNGKLLCPQYTASLLCVTYQNTHLNQACIRF